jgi:hypothetical protein
MHVKMPADKLVNLNIKISDYGTSFSVSAKISPEPQTLLSISPPKTSLANPSAKLQTYGRSVSISTNYSASELSSKNSAGTGMTSWPT